MVGERELLLGGGAPRRGATNGGGDVEAGVEQRQTASRYLARQPAQASRLLARGKMLGQSGGRWNIKHDWGDSRKHCISLERLGGSFVRARRRMYATAPFHTIVNLSSWRVIVLCAIMYMLAWCGFAVIYWWISHQEDGKCDLVGDTSRSKSHGGFTAVEAFFFSVETMATIGYGAPESIFFNSCPMMAALIPVQTIVGLVWDAVLLGVVFNRMSRGSPRAKTILFSDRAVARKIRGRYHFMLQVCEVRKHALLEAHVRMYCVRKDLDHLATGSVAYFQPFAMRLQHPDDELGGMLMMNLPNVVVHAMDAWSPLVPNPVDQRLWRDPEAPRTETNEAYDPAADGRFPDPLQRHVDCDQGNRTHITCGCCGSSFWNRMQLEQHMKYCEVSDRTAGYDMSLMCATCGEQFPSKQCLRRHVESSDSCDAPKEGWRGDDDAERKEYETSMHKVGGHQDSESVAGEAACESRDVIEAWMRDTQVEIIVLVEVR